MRREWILLPAIACFVGLSVPAFAQWYVLPIDGPGRGEYTSLEVDSFNRAHVSYYDRVRGSLWYAYFDGLSIVYDEVDQAGDVGKFSSLELDGNGYAHIAYYADAPAQDLKYAYWDGGNWNRTVVDNGNVVADWISLALDGSDRGHISYCRDDMLMHAWWDGSNWNLETVDPGPLVGYFSSIAVDASDFPHISYWDSVSDSLSYAWWNGATWQYETVDDQTSFSSLALDPSGVPHIAYQRSTFGLNSNLRYAYRSGATWAREDVPYAPSTNYGSYPSLRLGSDGNPSISFYDGDSLDLLFASKDGTWAIDRVDSLGDVGQYSSLALGSYSCPHISCYDATRDSLKYAVRWCPDIGPEAINSPADTVYPGVHNVRATIGSYGSTPSLPCSAHAWITPGTYSDYNNLPVLPPGSIALVSFANWVEWNPGTYLVCVATLLSGDVNPGNDTLCKYVVVATHDCGTDSIPLPPNRVLPGSTQPVRPWVQNHGNYEEIVGVRCWTTPTGAYSQTVSCTLAPGESKELQFPDWVVPGLEYTETFCCSTQLAQDFNPLNNKFCKEIDVGIIHDGGVEAILNPPDTVDPIGGPQPVQAQVRNCGTQDDDIPVLCTIDGYVARDTVFGVPPGVIDTVTFPTWDPAGGFGPWPMTCSTYVALDTITGNDALSKTVYAYLHDCGADTILVPPENAVVGTPYIPEVVVENYGDLPENVQVRCQIDGYDQTTILSGLAPGVVDTATFAAPWTPGAAGNYVAISWTDVAGDREATNDTTYKAIIVVGIEEVPVVPAVPRSLELSQNLPNPFGQETRIAFGLPVSGLATLRVYDLVGNLVSTLVDGVGQPGYHAVSWDGRDEKGREVSSGIYFYRLCVGDLAVTRKLAVMR